MSFEYGFDYTQLLPVAAVVAILLLGLAAWRWKQADEGDVLVPRGGRLNGWQAYLLAISATAATFGLRLALDGQLGGQPTLVIFTLPIMLSAFIGGLRAGLVATAVSYFAASYYLLPPIHSLAVASGEDRWQQLFVALAGVCISGLCEMLHRARRQAEVASPEQQHAESAGRASEDQFSSTFTHAAVGMALVAPDGRFLRVNRALCGMLGYAEAELLALTYQELTFAEDLDDKGRVRRLQAGEIDSFQMEKRYRHRQGRSVTVLVSVSIVRDATGRPIHQIAQVQDITERKVHEVEIARDITERKKAADQLQRSESSLANAQRIARIGSWDLDIATGALVWSAEIYEIFGYSRTDFGASFEAFMATVHPDDRDLVRTVQRAAIAGEVQMDFEHRIVRPDGTERIVHELADFTRDEDGRPARLSGTVQDITERVQAATKLRESEAQFHTMMDAMPLLAWMAEADGAIYWYNQQWYDYTGTTPAEMQGWGWQRVHDPAFLPKVVERWQAAINAGTFFEMDFPLRAADGSFCWFLTRVVPLKDPAGRVVRWFGTNTDITAKRVAAEEIANLNATLEQRVIERTDALRESEQRLAIAVQAARAGVWAWDIPSGQLVWSPEVFRIFGLDPTEPASVEKWQGLVHPEDLAQAEEGVANAIKNRTRLENEYRVVPRTGDVRWVSVLGNTSFADNGEPRRMSGVCLDITGRKRSELELRKLTAELRVANEELETFSTAVTRDLRVAEAADRIKSAFLATMSHELRTPLNSIIGFTGIVLMGKAGPLNGEQAKQLGMVRESARHLLALINDVLDISKIEAGQLKVSSAPFDLPASITRLMSMISPLAQNKSLLLTAEIDPQLGEMLSDQRRVEQILINLLTNAVKFTEDGRVTLTAELLANFRPSSNAAPQPSVCLRVTDTGIGIRPDNLALLFQPFHQLDTGPARLVEGTGLGLAICRRLASLLGGEIAAASTWSQGSEFTVILPLQKPSES